MKKCLLMVPMLLIAVQACGYDVEDEWDYVTFIDRQWDEKTQTLIEEERTVFCPVRDVSCSRGILTGKPKAEFYAFKGKLPEGVVSGPGLEVRGEVHIILMDGCELHPGYGITVGKTSTLHIYSQSNGDNQGKLTIYQSRKWAAIGGLPDESCGNIHIHGGHLTLKGGEGSAAIGCSHRDDFQLYTVSTGNIYVYGGFIDATGGDRGAGIGGGSSLATASCHPGTYHQYGGTVICRGGNTAAGLGGGGSYTDAFFIPNIKIAGGSGLDVYIYGGILNAYGGRRAAGIGAGNGIWPGLPGGGSFYIYGGDVYAKGGAFGAGIGGGCNSSGAKSYFYGGTVTAVGGIDAAGVGGGEDGDGSTVVVDGGTVRAEGSGYASGIGGGEGKYGHSFVYKSGKVVAIAGKQVKAREAKGGSAISSGYGEKNKRKTFNSNVIKVTGNNKVTAGDAEDNIERTFGWAEREPACRWRNFVRIEPCDHQKFEYHFLHYKETQHKKRCAYCDYEELEDHDFKGGKDCVCGKKYNAETSVWLVSVQHSTDGSTYTEADKLYVVRTRPTVLPQPQDIEGMIFMGYLASATAPASIEMKDDEFPNLIDAGQSITPTANVTYYARYRYDYNEEWTWNDEGTAASVKITNDRLGETQTIQAIVEEDESERIEPTGTSLGEMTFRANASYQRTAGVTYPFNEMIRIEYFNPAEFTLDAAATDNEEILEEYEDHLASVTINNLTLKKDGKLHPLCLPFAMEDWTVPSSPLSGATLYQYASAEKVGNQLQITFNKVTDKAFRAGEPYFVKWKSGTDIADPVFNGVRIKDSTPWFISDRLFFLDGTFDMIAVDGAEDGGTYLTLDDEKLTTHLHDIVEGFGNYLFVPHAVANDDAIISSVRLTFEDDLTVERLLGYSWEGKGTAEQPYIISNARQLKEMAAFFNANDPDIQGRYFRQGANIIFDKTVENDFTPISSFNGHYDGAGFTISGVNMNMTEGNNASLFGTMEGNSTVKNVIVAVSTFKGHNAAPIAGFTNSTASVENCHVLKDVTVEAITFNAGGVVANVYDGSTVKQSTSQAAVKGKVYAGGIAGYMVGGSILGCTYLGNSVACGEGQLAKGGAILGMNSAQGEKVNDCYFTAPTLKDDLAKLMPAVSEDNTNFLDQLYERDQYLLEAGLTEDQIGYDLTLNGREYKATQQADGTWKRWVYSICLPFDMDLAKLDNANDIKVYKLHEVDVDNKMFLFTNDFPILKAGEPYMIVVEKGALTFKGTNILAAATPKEPLTVNNADASKEVGWWCGTFKRLENEQLVEEKAYLFQKNGTFRLIERIYTSRPYIKQFQGYFSAMDLSLGSVYQMKFIQTENGVETGNITDFPADEFDCDFDLDDETGINEVRGQKEDERGDFYNLAGQRVDQPNKGIYIQNGKKIVIK